MEKTLVIIKPCALQRSLAGEVLSRFEKKGLKIVALKMYRFTKEKCAEHYAHLVGKSFYHIIESSMMAAPASLRSLYTLPLISIEKWSLSCARSGFAASISVFSASI